MDRRCPLGLKCYPSKPCPLAVERLKGLEKAGNNLSHSREEALLGCSWAVSDKDANYCFFKYMHDNAGLEHLTTDISEKLKISKASVYSSLSRAIEKLKDTELIQYLRKDAGFKKQE